MKQLSLIALLFSAPLWATAEEAPDFNTHVLPILQKHCAACHSADEAEGGLIVESYDRLMGGGRRGPAVVAGRPEQSRLVLLTEGKAKPVMPPEGNDRPKPEELAVLRSWVAAGAKGPSGAAPDPTKLLTPAVPLKRPARAQINSLAVSPDGATIATAAYGRVRLVSAATGELLRELADARGNVNQVSFSRDGARVVAACGEAGLFGEAKLWNVADGALVRTVVAHRDSLYAAVLSPDGQMLATAGYDEKIKLWNVADGAELRTIAGHNGAIYDLAFRPDGKVLASASADRTVKLWDVASGNRLETFGQPLKELYTVVWSPDGTRLAAAGADNRIRVWGVSGDAREGTNPVLFTRFAHQGTVARLAWSRDGQTLASAAEDRTLKLWEARSMTERFQLELQPDWPVALDFSADQQWLAVGRLDGSLARYQVSDGQPLAWPARSSLLRPLVREGLKVALRHSKPWLSAASSVALLGFLADEAKPAPPQVTALTPRGVQRGAAARVKLSGANLASAQEIKSNHPALSVKLLADPAPQAGEVWIEATAAADLPRGGYDLVLTTPSGAAPSARLFVDDVPQVMEQSAPADPAGQEPVQKIALPSGVWGVLDRAGDVDEYALDVTAGQTLVFDIEANRIGSKANVVITLYDPRRRALASSNDFDGQADPLLAWTFTEAGTYRISVADLAQVGSAEHFYRLTAGELPLVTGCFPLSIPANRRSTVALTGYNLPPDARATIAAGGPAEAVVPVDAEAYRVRRELKVVVSDSTEVLEAEPNGQPRSATPMIVPGVANGRIHGRTGEVDADLYRFDSPAGKTWLIETEAARRGSPLDTRIEILDLQGQPIERLWLQAVRDSYVTFRGIDSNTIDVRLKNWEEMGLNEWVYLQGEVGKIFRMPQGPDSGVNLYASAGKRMCYFDTSPTVHALDEPAYIVEPHRPGTALVPTGLPVFKLYYANDDDGDRKAGTDSRVAFTAPADGSYLVRVTDVRGQQGDRFAYRLIVREPKPDFTVSLSGNATVAAGSSQEFTLNVERSDGFDGEISVEFGGLPAGFSITSPVVIQAGHSTARTVLTAAADAAMPADAAATASTVKAVAVIAGSPVEKPVNNLGKITLAAAPKLLVRLEADPSAMGPNGEVLVRPGTLVPAWLKVERHGFDDRINFDVNNLPHGVIVDDIGLNGVLIPEKQTERKIFLNCAPWVTALQRPFHAVARAEGNQASRPIVLQVER